MVAKSWDDEDLDGIWYLCVLVERDWLDIICTILADSLTASSRVIYFSLLLICSILIKSLSGSTHILTEFKQFYMAVSKVRSRLFIIMWSFTIFLKCVYKHLEYHLQCYCNLAISNFLMLSIIYVTHLLQSPELTFQVCW